ncbi:MAG TPA: glycogen debranching N-terminal domain-containing protein [Candidatus Dormibacteraeota bacterium]
MPESLVAIDGTSFVISERSGDISGGTQGLYVRDARYLSSWRLLVDGLRPSLLTAHHVDPYSTLVFLMNSAGGTLPPNAVSVIRRRVVGAGMEEEIELQSHLDRHVEFDIRLDVEADFLDLFEVKAKAFSNPGDRVFIEAAADHDDNRNAVGPRPGGTLAYEQRRGSYFGQVAVDASPPPDVDARGMSWHVFLPAHGVFTAVLQVSLRIDDEALIRRHGLADFGRVRGSRRLTEGVGPGLARLATSWHSLQETYDRGADDLFTLLIDEPDLASGLPAAGLPWFMTVFGRDTLVTALQLLPGGQWLGWSAIDTLARLQATVDDPIRDAQPGKIVHELRRGPTAINGGHFPYYGTIDAPMLFVILLHELWRWSGDDERVRRYRPNAEAVLRWMETDGDLDGDGFIEWRRRAASGLENQAWKDSWDAFRRHDGSLASGPLASCEVQGYAYDALVRAAELAAGPWEDAALAETLRQRARRLHDRFNERFWTDARGGYYFLALDGQKQPVDSLTSNIGHLLWSGIVPLERSDAVARQLLSRALFSGWGVRTMAGDDHGFNPISYHCGTVWPHDNSIIVAGLHRYGFHDEANRIMTAIIDAAAEFPDHRLPEVFAGYSRDVGPFPVEYPTASSPQAWAAASSMLMLRASLGLEPDAVTRTVRADPHLPAAATDLEMRGFTAFGRVFDIRVAGRQATVEPAA